MIDPIAITLELGFDAAYLLPVPRTQSTTHPYLRGASFVNEQWFANLTEYNAILIGISGYVPFDTEQLCASYYPASNRSYHAMQKVRDRLNQEGIVADPAFVPVRHLLLEHGIGARMDNQLLYFAPFGTYVVLQSLVLKMEDPHYSAQGHAASVCDHCGACRNACFGAIENDGTFRADLCLRTHYYDTPLPLETMQKMESLLGCMRCQRACPKNPKATAPIPKELQDLLDPVALLYSDRKSVRAALGSNIKWQGVLKQAIVLCGNQNRTDALPRLYELREQNDPNLSEALEYSITLLQNEESVVK